MHHSNLALMRAYTHTHARVVVYIHIPPCTHTYARPRGTPYVTVAWYGATATNIGPDVPLGAASRSAHRLHSRLTPSQHNIMAKIDDNIIKKVLDATDIVDVIGDFVELSPKGVRYIGLCPFHDDRHATNFVVYPKKRCYKCFACGAKGDVVKFLQEKEKMSFGDAIRWLGKRYNIDVDDRTVALDVKKRVAPPPLPTLFLPTHMMNATLGRDSTFHRWLRSLPWSPQQAPRVDEVLEEYNVGATRQGFTVFWQMDDGGWIRTGHCMLYRKDGHRVKDEECAYNADWIHSMLRRDVVRDERGRPVLDKQGKQIPRWPQFADTEAEMRQTLFGMHLLNKYPTADVHIVESEKTAIICAIYFGNDNKQLWMASCGKYNLTAERLAPIIKARRVIALHPDKDGADEWRAKMDELAYSRAYINDAMMKLHWQEQDGPKADIADIIIRLLYESHRAKTVRRLSEIMPSIKPATAILLTDKLKEQCLTKTDRTGNKPTNT